MDREDVVLTSRNMLSALIVIFVYFSIFYSSQFENMRGVISFLMDDNINTPLSNYNYLLFAILGLRVIAAGGIFFKRLFNTSVYVIVTISCIGIILSSLSAHYALGSSCSIGMFNENPYVIISYEIIILILSLVIFFNKDYVFNK